MSKKKNETIILLHGIGHNKCFMAIIAVYLKLEGYKTVNISYPSRHKKIKDLAVWLDKELTRRKVWDDAEKIHFVAHSMGGLVSGYYLQDYKEKVPKDKLGRVIMLGTPNKGSEVTDGLKHTWWYKFVFGPAGQELTTDLRANDYVEPYYELGVVAGNSNWLYPFKRFFPSDANDGCVTVESTKLEGMKDHITLSVLHGDMGWDLRVRKQILHFLKYGEFDHAGKSV
jgi:pimeloyl-ACP methyl ester carboxylesterase